MKRIVVGVDGSEHSERALQRAAEEAALRGATVEAVYVFSLPHRPLSFDLIGLPHGAGLAGRPVSPDAPAHHPPTAMQEAQEHADRQLEQLVARVLGPDAVRTTRMIAIGSDHPAESLISHSRDAELLVIGTRGLGGFTGMLLGSVAHQCVQHCRCPMLILPPADE
jgi:nucleotide-binding universal stress UspA family protein